MQKVLIVDDKYENAYLLEKLFQSVNYQTSLASNGMEALNLALIDPPDLIISDILMPVMDGFTFCTTCKQNPVLRNVPFVFYTATYTTTKDETFALSIGADKFIVKPMDPDKFLDVINTVLSDFSNKLITGAAPVVKQDSVYLKQYNEVLIRKLEDKMIQAEQNEIQLRKYTKQLEDEYNKTLQAQDALKKSEAYLQALINDNRACIWAVNSSFALTIYNKAFADFLRQYYSTQPVQGSLLPTLLPESTWQIWESYYKKAFAGEGLVFPIEENILGKAYYGEALLNPILTDGIITGVSCISADATARKQAESALRESERWYRTIFSSTGTAMLVFEESLVISLANDELINLLGYDRAFIENNSKVVDFIFRDDIPRIAEEYRNLRLFPNAPSRPLEVRLICRDTVTRYAIVTMSVLPNTNKCIASINDITTIKETKEELRLAKDKAQAMSRLKSNFLANMSHELRTPLIGILGYSELLLDQYSADEIEKFAKSIHKGASRLMETLNMILDFSIIESDKLELTLTEVRVDEILRNCIKQMHNLAINKHITLSLELPETPLTIFTNERMTREVFYNLLNNAVKYTSTGGVCIRVETETINSEAWVVIKFIDTGIGIDKINQSIIWEEFRQVSEGMERGYEGTGLGLTISKRFIEKLGGTIHLESELGVGSTFTVRLPLRPLVSNHPAQLGADRGEMNSRHDIMIIEADSMTADYIRLLLEGLYSIHTADTLEDAHILLRKHSYSLLVVDITPQNESRMIEFIKSAHRNAEINTVAIVAMTPYTAGADNEQVSNAGCKFQLKKPFSKGSFLTLIEKALK